VLDIMTQTVVTATPDTPLPELIDEMVLRRGRCPRRGVASPAVAVVPARGLR
jgi:CBS domain-containing protein